MLCKRMEVRLITCGLLSSARWYFPVSRKKYATQRNVPQRTQRNATHDVACMCCVSLENNLDANSNCASTCLLSWMYWMSDVCGRRGDSGRRDGGRVPVCVDRATSRTEWWWELFAIYWTDAHLVVQPTILCSTTTLRKHESPGKSLSYHPHATHYFNTRTAYFTEHFWTVLRQWCGLIN